MNTLDLTAVKRSELGYRGAEALRKESMVPGVVYGGGDVLPVSIHRNALRTAVYTSKFNIINLDVDGQVERCIVKDVQFHPVTDAMVHVDFLRVIDNVPIKVELPITFSGDSPGVRAGGTLQAKMRKIKVKALPKYLVSSLNADISNLELGFSVRAKDLDVPEGIEIMSPLAIPVGSVEIPRALRSATAGEEGEEGEEEAGAEEAAV